MTNLGVISCFRIAFLAPIIILIGIGPTLRTVDCRYHGHNEEGLLHRHVGTASEMICHDTFHTQTGETAIKEHCCLCFTEPNSGAGADIHISRAGRQTKLNPLIIGCEDLTSGDTKRAQIRLSLRKVPESDPGPANLRTVCLLL
jgi:hypothetical protein